MNTRQAQPPTPEHSGEINVQQEIENMLDTPGFPQFIASLPEMDRPYENDYTDMKEKMDLFVARESLKESIKNTYTGHINAKLGIDLHSGELTAMDAHLDKLSIEDPERIYDLVDTVDRFGTYQDTITESEQRMNELVGDPKILEDMKKARDEFRTAVATLDKAQGMFGQTNELERSYLWCLTSDMRKQQKAARDLYAEVANITVSGVKIIRDMKAIDNEQIGVIRDQYIQALNDIESKLAEHESISKSMKDLKHGFDVAKEHLLYAVAEVGEIREIVKDKVDAYMAAPKQVRTHRGVAQAMERFFQVAAANNDNQDVGFDLFNRDKFDSYSARRRAVDTFVEDAVPVIIAEAIDKLRLGKNSFTNLENSLEDLFRLETMGTKDADETRHFIADSIIRVVDGLPDNPENRAKKILANRIIVKIYLGHHRKPPKIRT